MMYEWLNKEAETVKWRKFFVFKRNTEPQVIATVEKQFAALPTDYKTFLYEHGESRLFRSLNHPSYNMGVFSTPRSLEGRKGELLLEIGFFINGGYAHFRRPKGAVDAEPGVFEGAGLQVRKAADSFEEWLKKRFERAKKLYKKSDWKLIIE